MIHSWFTVITVLLISFGLGIRCSRYLRWCLRNASWRHVPRGNAVNLRRIFARLNHSTKIFKPLQNRYDYYMYLEYCINITLCDVSASMRCSLFVHWTDILTLVWMWRETDTTSLLLSGVGFFRRFVRLWPKLWVYRAHCMHLLFQGFRETCSQLFRKVSLSFAVYSVETGIDLKEPFLKIVKTSTLLGVYCILI